MKRTEVLGCHEVFRFAERYARLSEKEVQEEVGRMKAEEFIETLEDLSEITGHVSIEDALATSEAGTTWDLEETLAAALTMGETLSEFCDLTDEITKNWESGDLAGAIRLLAEHAEYVRERFGFEREEGEGGDVNEVHR